MIYEPDGFDHYDTVCCVGPYMVDEIRRREEMYGLPAKELVEHGYGRLDAILESAATPPALCAASGPPVVLIAPSWGPTCIFETCGEQLVRVLLDAGYEVIARPHPMTDEEDARARSPALAAAFARSPAVHARHRHRRRTSSLHRSRPDGQRLVGRRARVRVRTRAAGAVRRRAAQGQQPRIRTTRDRAVRGRDPRADRPGRRARSARPGAGVGRGAPAARVRVQ